eukprot:3794502-Rhodomonas_salina.1
MEADLLRGSEEAAQSARKTTWRCPCRRVCSAPGKRARTSDVVGLRRKREEKVEEGIGTL